MIDKEISNLTAIDTLIRQEQPFAVYRIPGEAAPHLLMQATGNVRLLHDLEELDGERGFVIAPFRVSEESPIVLIQPEEPEHFLLPDENRRPSGCFRSRKHFRKLIRKGMRLVSGHL